MENYEITQDDLDYINEQTELLDNDEIFDENLFDLFDSIDFDDMEQF